MNTLIAVAIAPFGVGDELAPEVAEVVKVIRDRACPIIPIPCSPKLKVSGMRL